MRIPFPSASGTAIKQQPLPASEQRAPFGEEPIEFSTFLMLLATFLVFSRFPEIVQMATGIQLSGPVTVIVGLALLSALLSRQNLLKALVTRATGYYTAFTIWMIICIPFSVWRGGSVELMRFVWLPALLFTAVAVISIREERHFHLLAKVMAASSLTITLVSMKLGYYSEADGRFMFTGGSLKNSNDLSVLLCIGLPFFFLPLLGRDWGLFGKVFAIPAIMVHVIIILRTGSRAALLTLVLLLLLLLLFTTAAKRVTMLILMWLVAIAGIALTPDLVVARLKSTFGKDDPFVLEAINSRRGRIHKFWSSVALTLQHPIFGVGPGVYLPAQAAADEAEGKRPDWLASHNTLTQVSSETGIPGLLIYTLALVSTIVRLQKARRICARYPFMESEANLTMTFQLSLCGLVVGNLFGSNAYIFFMPVMVVMGDKLHEQVTRKFEILRAEAAAAKKAKTVPAALPNPPVAERPALALPPPRRPLSSLRSQPRTP